MNISENKLNYFQKVEGIAQRTYYHYTSLDALFNIVKSRTFRLTSLRSSNDRKELFYTVNQYLSDLNAICEKEANANTKQCFQRLIKSVENNRSRFEKEVRKTHTAYALCLSKRRDNLTHWDRYAASCTGVCIGVNLNALDILYRRTGNHIFGMGLFDIGETFYTSDSLLGHIRNTTVRLINDLFGSTEEHPQIDPIKIIDLSGFVYMASVYLTTMKFAKSSSFIDEDEIRLYHETESIRDTARLIRSMSGDLSRKITTDLVERFNKLIEITQIKEEHFMMTRSGIRGYHNLCLGEIWGSGVIPEIILGPMCVQNRKELERFLRSNGLGDTKISASKVPIR